MDFTYCYETCPIGRAASEEFLSSNNSVMAAVADFKNFTKNCFKTCPHSRVHVNYKQTRRLHNEIDCR